MNASADWLNAHPEIGEFYWHVHHNVLCELLTEPIESRIAYIRANKPFDEVETRLRLLRPVKGVVPKALEQASYAFQLQRAIYEQACTDCLRGRYPPGWIARLQIVRDYDRVWRDSEIELEQLHALECPDCPWDGKTIFPPSAQYERRSS